MIDELSACGFGLCNPVHLNFLKYFCCQTDEDLLHTRCYAYPFVGEAITIKQEVQIFDEKKWYFGVAYHFTVIFFCLNTKVHKTLQTYEADRLLRWMAIF